MPTAATLEAFIARVVSNAHVEAIEEFYTEGASMQENFDTPRVGRELLVARERAALARSAAVYSECVRPVFVDGDHVVIRWIFEFTGQDGTVGRMEELAYQRWEGERIAQEQFFYDPKQLAPRPGAAAIEVRAAREDDAPAIAACACRAYVHYVERIGRQPAPMVEDYATVIREAQVHVATLAGRVVGALVLKPLEEGFYVDNVAVLPAIKGRGLGKQLLMLAEDEARRQGFGTIFLATHEKMVENRAIYAHLGYDEYDHRVVAGYPRVFMRKALTPT